MQHQRARSANRELFKVLNGAPRHLLVQSSKVHAQASRLAAAQQLSVGWQCRAICRDPRWLTMSQVIDAIAADGCGPAHLSSAARRAASDAALDIMRGGQKCAEHAAHVFSISFVRPAVPPRSPPAKNSSSPRLASATSTGSTPHAPCRRTTALPRFSAKLIRSRRRRGKTMSKISRDGYHEAVANLLKLSKEKQVRRAAASTFP